MKKAITLLTILAAIFSATSSANAFAWKPKHFNGSYYCVGHGEDYVWVAILESDGFGQYVVEDVIGWPGGNSDVKTTSGSYDINPAGYLVMRFGTGEAEGVMVQRGKGVLLTNAGSLFVGECWREK